MVLENDFNQEAFFQAVENISTTRLADMQKKIGLETMAKMAELYNDKGETPLMRAIKGNYDAVVQFLVMTLNVNISQTGQFSWKEQHYAEVPPVFVAILSNQKDKNPSIVDILIDQDMVSESSIVLPSVLGSSISLVQKIDILELIGAAYIMKNSSLQKSVTEGIQFWVEATRLRLSEPTPILKIPYNKSKTSDVRSFLGNITEFTTVEELEPLLERPDLRFLQTQAQLVTQRVISQMDPEPHPFFLHQLLKYDHKWCEDNAICVKVFIMDIFQELQWKDSVNYDWTVNIILKQLYLLHSISIRTRSLTYLITTIKYAFAVVSKTRKHPIAKFYEDIEQMHIHMVFDLIPNVNKLLPLLTPQGKEEFKKLVSHYIRFTSSTVSPFPGVTTLLQWAFLMPGMFSIEFIQLFLEAGANRLILTVPMRRATLLSITSPEIFLARDIPMLILRS